MKNSKLFLIFLSNIVQIIFYYSCYKISLDLLLIQYSILSLCFSIPYLVHEQPKQRIYFIIFSAIPIYLLSILVYLVNIYAYKLFDYLDSKEQIIK